jgi:hypothetical protein
LKHRVKQSDIRLKKNAFSSPGVLEATYDHPPSQSIRSCRSSEGQRSLAEMWEEVMSAAASNKAEQDQQLQSQLHEEEHLYQEIPCYHPRVDVHDSRC